MYIDLKLLFLGICGFLGIITLILIILVLFNLFNVLKNVNELIIVNKKDINKLCKDLPKISEKSLAICDNVKDLSDVATEATAEAIVAKDSLLENFESIKDILSIVLSVFFKK